ncbi:MAG: type II secretion system protein [Candidatus Omnitrophota bacterium]|nr:type II secretion system GspH family protein [Candidatus Omnitrophota bacterium]
MKKSVTMIEIVVSAVILAVAFTLLISAFMTTRRYTTRANRRVIANNWIRSASNYLYKEMVQTGPTAPSFSSGQHGLPFNDTEVGCDPNTSKLIVESVDYIGYYTVVDDGNNRNITFNVTYESIDID